MPPTARVHCATQADANDTTTVKDLMQGAPACGRPCELACLNGLLAEERMGGTDIDANYARFIANKSKFKGSGLDEQFDLADQRCLQQRAARLGVCANVARLCAACTSSSRASGR